jgi:hypothetical protein
MRTQLLTSVASQSVVAGPSSAPAVEPATVAFSMAPAFTGASRNTLYRLAARGEITLIKVGRATLLDVASWREFIARQPRASIRAAA